jgi:hypothetical protein
MQQAIENLIVLGMLGLLLLLRLDAPRFGVAEYDDSGRNGSWRAWTRRLAWFAIGIALVLLVYWLYPQQISVLHLDIGGTVGAADRGKAMLYGLAIGALGIIGAAIFAWGRYGGIRLPAPGAYPGAIVNSVGTAIVDEATFRGILLGLLLHQGIDPWIAIGIAAVVYAVATRLTARGRSKGMLVIDLMLAIVGGWTVVETGGIGAAVLGHAITRFAIFLLTGHSDQSRPFGWEPEAVAGRAMPPKGWDVAGRTAPAPPWSMTVVGADRGIPAGPVGPGSMYAGESPFAGQGYLQPAPPYPGQPGWDQGSNGTGPDGTGPYVAGPNGVPADPAQAQWAAQASWTPSPGTPPEGQPARPPERADAKRRGRRS